MHDRYYIYLRYLWMEVQLILARPRNPEQCQAFLDAYNAGKTKSEASKEAGWHPSTGGRYLKYVKENEPWKLRGASDLEQDAVQEEAVLLEHEEMPAEPPEMPQMQPTDAKTDKSTGASIPTGNMGLESNNSSDTKKRTMNLDITGLDSFLKIISAVNGISQTRYIRGLISAEMEKNRDKLERLKKDWTI